MELIVLAVTNVGAVITAKMAYRYVRMICGFNDANASHDRETSASYASTDIETLKKVSRNDEDLI
jgi:hypothetical protein